MDSGYISSRTIVARRFSDGKESRDCERREGRWRKVKRTAIVSSGDSRFRILRNGMVKLKSGNFCDIPERNLLEHTVRLPRSPVRCANFSKPRSLREAERSFLGDRAKELRGGGVKWNVS